MCVSSRECNAASQSFLIERLANLAQKYPRLDIDLATNLRSISLQRHEADIAIRADRPKDGDVIAKPAVLMGYGFYATPNTSRRIDNGGAGFHRI